MCDLAPGDEVTIAYVDVATPRAARRSDLEKRFAPRQPAALMCSVLGFC
jgi:hypothetical protein